MKQPYPARLHLLPAKDAPIVVVIRRQPSRRFHILQYFTGRDYIAHGSWFTGKLYPLRCDVSFDGQWMVYLAMGARGNTWNGVCAVPWLKTHLEGSNMGTWLGGGMWRDRQTLLLNGWQANKGNIPFNTAALVAKHGAEDLSVLYPRLARDGWQRVGPNWGEMKERKKSRKYTVDCLGDEGWWIRPSDKHPELRMRYLGYLAHGNTFAFSLSELPQLLADKIQWACYDCTGNLIVAESGWIKRYSLGGLACGTPDFTFDLNNLDETATSTTKQGHEG